MIQQAHWRVQKHCSVDEYDVLPCLELPLKCVLPCFSTFLLALYNNAFLGYCEVCFLLMRSSLPLLAPAPLCVLYVVKNCRLLWYCQTCAKYLYICLFHVLLNQRRQKNKKKTKWKIHRECRSIVVHRHISVWIHTCAHWGKFCNISTINNVFISEILYIAFHYVCINRHALNIVMQHR